MNHKISQPPGVLVPGSPVQVNYEPVGHPFAYKNYTLTPLASYNIQARVLSLRTYWVDRFADLSPVDFAMGWQKMSDTTVLDAIHLSQDDRFYFYSWKLSAPIPQDEMVASSANMHLIPADSSISEQIKNVKVGQVISLKGDLVEAVKASGWKIRSSLSRTDTGPGACEVMWVTEVIDQ